MAFLEVDGISLTLDRRRVLDNVSFSAERGTITALCGPNGSGKTCLLRIVKGLLKPDCGSVFLDGENLTGSASKRLFRVGLVFQDADVQTVGETVEKDIMFGPRNLGWTEESVLEATEQVISLLGMSSFRKQRPQALSGGERRCLAIAGVLAMKPQTILLDEPFANLDLPSVRCVLRALLRLRETGICIVIVSHEADRFLAHADSAVVLDAGKMVWSGRARDSLSPLGEHGVHVPNVAFEEMTWL